MAYKFYYNGQLMRTSKNHIYTHAVVTASGKCYSCSSTREGCVKELTSAINYWTQKIQNAELKIKALEEGKAGFYYMDGRKKAYCKFDKNYKFDTLEYAREELEHYKENVEWFKTYKIVELEMR